MKEKTRRLGFFSVETIIIVAIACCMIFLNYFTINKLNELQQAKNDALFIRDGVVFDDESQFAEEIVHYLPDTYKLIELYDEDLDIMFQMQFNDGFVLKDSIRSHPDLMNILSSHDEGQTTVDIGGMKQDVYFKWMSNNHGEVRLLIVYSAVKNVEGVWVFSLVCYLVLVLVFLLLIITRVKAFHEKVYQYGRSTRRVREHVNS